MIARIAVIALLVVAAASARAADDQPWALAETITDTVYFKDGDPQFGNVVEENGKRFLVTEKGGKFELVGNQIDHIELKRLASEIVAHNAPIHIAKKNARELIRTLEFGNDKKAVEAVDAALRAGLKAMPGDTDLAVYAFAHLTSVAEVADVARTVLATNDLFEPAYEALANALMEDDHLDELDKLVRTWLVKRPTSQTANRLMAEAAVKRKDYRTAAECYRKLRDLFKDKPAILWHAVMMMALGDYKTAHQNALDAIAANVEPIVAKGVAGSALLALGKAGEALPLLQESVAGQDVGGSKLVQYNLAVAQIRVGDLRAARATIEALKSTASAVDQADVPAAADLALAIAEHKPFRDLAALTDPRLKAIAQELNACLDLEAGQHARAVAALDPSSSKRHRFLTEVGEVLAKNGDDASARALAVTPGVESLRWQAYAHMLAGRWRDAESTLAKLPENDGWAAVYRVYCAAVQHDEAGAKAAYQRIAASTAPPADYLARLAAEYEIAEAARDLEEFDWKDGEVLGTGWQSAANGTNIRISAQAGRLVLEGAQTASPDPVSRAWRLVQSERLRGAVVEFDLSGIAGASAGIEITDVERTGGVELAVLGDGFLAWRALAGGRWGAWEKLAMQVAGARPKLMIRFQNGVVSAASPERPDISQPLGPRLFNTAPSMLSVGVFGTSEPGVAWKLAVESFELQLKPAR